MAEDARPQLLMQLSRIAEMLSAVHVLDEGTCSTLRKNLDVIERSLGRIPDVINTLDELSIDGVSKAPSREDRQLEIEDGKPYTDLGARTSGNEEGAAVEFQEEADHEGQEIVKLMGDLVQELNTRNKELKHVHDMTILKFENAAQKIITLEKQIKELETERSEQQSELMYLKLQLKTLEVQMMENTPESSDQGLMEGIRRWKEEWSDVEKKSRHRREPEHRKTIPWI